MIDLSLGEFRALVAKALRGAGYSWGLTEDASYAAKRLAEFGLAPGETVVALANAVDGTTPAQRMPDGSWQPTGDGLCPVCVGTTIIDQGGCDRLDVGATWQPNLLAPLLASSLAPDDELGYRIEWATGACDITRSTITTTGNCSMDPVPLTIVRQSVEPGTVALHRRVLLTEDTMAELERLAHRIYAPNTEASRLGGAGAGTSDND